MPVSRHVPAPATAVFRALTEPRLLERWLAPDGMVGRIDTYEARPGGRIRMSLTYQDASLAGKSGGATDTFRGRVLSIVPGERVAWLVEFESEDAANQGEMTVTWSLRSDAEGTLVTVHFEGLPPGIDPEENAEGSRQSLAKLAALVGSEGPRAG